jgi:hypothetical protein
LAAVSFMLAITRCTLAAKSSAFSVIVEVPVVP